MVSVSEAYNIILKHPFTPSDALVALTDAAGKVLAEPVYADRDFPPFDRVAMDGIAIVYEKLRQGQLDFEIEAIQPAGSPKIKLIDPSRTIEVMTGAVLPDGTDTVIRYEDIVINAGKASVKNDKVQARQHIHKQAQDARRGDELLRPGILLSPAEIALLASVGKSKVIIRDMPEMAVISTGDELVDVDAIPEPHQIRRSNTYALFAALSQLACRPVMYHLSDDAGAMHDKLHNALGVSDALILSGGVSKGKFDYVPQVLEKLGVKKIFHQVNQRPGKPFWFGISREGKPVFALPGNPVSTYVCFYRYIKPWLLKGLGADTVPVQVVLADNFSFNPAMTYFLQVHVKNERGTLMAYPHPGGGSGDFVNLKDVTGFLELPADSNDFLKGEAYFYYPFR